MKTIGVSHIPTLKAMAKAGVIKLHEQTGTKITGLYSPKKFTCCYIDDYIGRSTFEFGGNIYRVEYVSGCFCPYVFKISDAYAAYEKLGKFAFVFEKANYDKIDKNKYIVRFLE